MNRRKCLNFETYLKRNQFQKQKKAEKEEKPAEEIKVEEAEAKEKVAEPKPVVEPGKVGFYYILSRCYRLSNPHEDPKWYTTPRRF